MEDRFTEEELNAAFDRVRLAEEQAILESNSHIFDVSEMD